MSQPTGKEHKISNVFVDQLETPYPSVNFKAIAGCKLKGWYMAERQGIKEQWGLHLATYDVKEGENIAFWDQKSGELIGMVIQGLAGDPNVVRTINDGVFDHLDHVKQMMRRSDPGRMGGVGYTSRAYSLREFVWGRNMKKMKKKDAQRNLQISCYFAHVWTLIMQVLPEQVLAEYSEAIEKLSGIHMDGGTQGKGSGTLKYKLVEKGVKVEYETATLAPSSGTVAKNYSRYRHKETNLNQYCTSWTSNRYHPLKDGGSFYIATYGI